MDNELYEWLRERWNRDNIQKYQHYFEPWINSYINWLVAESKNIDEDAIKICINYEKWEWNLITKLGNKINLRNKDIKKYALYHFYKYLI